MDLPSPSPELGAWLAENRESLIRRWLELVVERSTLEELAARPMAERVRELDLLLEAARSEGSTRHGSLGPELDEALTAALAAGRPFALALLAPPAGGPAAQAWAAAAAETGRREERVVATEAGLTAVVIPAPDADAARIEADRIRAGAWQRLGGASVLPDVGVAAYPADATEVAGLVDAARMRLPEHCRGEAVAEPCGPPALGEEVRVSRGEDAPPREDRRQPARDIWRELSDDEPRRPDDEGPQADVTPLYPSQPD